MLLARFRQPVSSSRSLTLRSISASFSTRDSKMGARHIKVNCVNLGHESCWPQDCLSALLAKERCMHDVRSDFDPYELFCHFEESFALLPSTAFQLLQFISDFYSCSWMVPRVVSRSSPFSLPQNLRH